MYVESELLCFFENRALLFIPGYFPTCDPPALVLHDLELTFASKTDGLSIWTVFVSIHDNWA